MLTPEQLAAAVAAARARLARPWEPDTGLPAAVDAARGRLGLAPRYLDADELERLRAQPLPGSAGHYERSSTWEDRSACPDCYAFRAPSSRSCKRCGSDSRPIPAHERARASAGTRERAARRRYEKRRRVVRGY